mmetsp:Transcript_30947/g.47194  ORF Transcript_30947/g.47194 Transcript_30947/m.47194 type:complete len:224 (+) Transcript_30947:30-701(+)
MFVIILSMQYNLSPCCNELFSFLRMLSHAATDRLFLFVTLLGTFLLADAFEPSGFFGVKMNSSFTKNIHPLVMGMKIKIRMVGRKNGGEKWLEDAYTMYKTRVRTSNIEVETIWHKNDNEIIRGVEQDVSKGHSVLLDPRGKMKSSEQFCEDLYGWLNQGGSRLVFVLGGADGLPPEIKSLSRRSSFLLSLSTMTFTHQFARTVLVEQIYRASEIKKGSGYHK